MSYREWIERRSNFDWLAWPETVRGKLADLVVWLFARMLEVAADWRDQFSPGTCSEGKHLVLHARSRGGLDRFAAVSSVEYRLLVTLGAWYVARFGGTPYGVELVFAIVFGLRAEVYNYWTEDDLLFYGEWFYGDEVYDEPGPQQWWAVVVYLPTTQDVADFSPHRYEPIIELARLMEPTDCYLYAVFLTNGVGQEYGENLTYDDFYYGGARIFAL